MTNGPSLTALLDDFAADLATSGKSDRTQYIYAAAVRSFIDHVDSDDAAELTRSNIRAWLSSMGDLKGSTRRIRFASMHLFVEWCILEQVISSDPMSGMKRPVAQATPMEPFSQAEIDSLLDACAAGNTFADVRDELTIRLLLATGIRLHELVSITLGAIDGESRTILVLGKGGKYRTVSFDETTARILRRYRRRRYMRVPKDEQALLIGQRGAWGTDGVDTMLRRRGRQAGVAGVRCHRFRATWAIRWLQAGGSEGSLRTLAGWSSGSSMLQRYVASRAESLAVEEARRLQGR
jgi:site-specific recombinase XerD